MSDNMEIIAIAGIVALAVWRLPNLFKVADTALDAANTIISFPFDIWNKESDVGSAVYGAGQETTNLFNEFSDWLASVMPKINTTVVRETDYEGGNVTKYFVTGSSRSGSLVTRFVRTINVDSAVDVVPSGLGYDALPLFDTQDAAINWAIGVG